MNHYAPRQLQGGPSAGKWHYTCLNDRTGVFASGACADGCPGHDTAEEACEHERQRLLGQLTFQGPRTGWPKYQCRADGCEAEGTMLASLRDGWTYFELCEAHATPETVGGLVRVGVRWSS
jgi:hypothetical protein